MSEGGAGAPSGLAAERTRLARVRTVVAVLMTSAIVGRATVPARPAAALLCLVVAVVAVVMLRLRPPVSHGVLVGCVVTLAAVGFVGF
ncbi:DUF202 domain-containing protein [Tsukamurella pseudospumae]|uniref:DUF202 domain-containing protein n=1 Tax=Tsukamurella pseudospumae TaxID=239498 RepID=A0A137ZMZ7_9ACTN|nr:DUF202 domain-containing protein [Tsukamurella pseudospumae]KXO99559.1 hypothetical protein AXK61_17185 [Tsukamurella pseudospumae]